MNRSVLITYKNTTASLFSTNNESERGKLWSTLERRFIYGVITSIVFSHHGPITPGPDQPDLHIFLSRTVLA